MMGLKFMGDVPFRDVYITGLIRDENGEKMSKAKGNIIDPLDLVDGIDLASLVAKRTSGMMQPHLTGDREGDAQAVSRRHRRLRHRACASLRGARGPSRDINFDLGPRRRLPQFLQQAVERRALRLMTFEGSADLDRRGRAVGRGSLDRLALRRHSGESRRVAARVPLRLRGDRALRIHLVRVLRLVSRADEARTAERDHHGCAEARHAPHARHAARRTAARAAPDDAVHHGGDLAARESHRPAARGRGTTCGERQTPSTASCSRVIRRPPTMRATPRRKPRSRWMKQFILAVRQIRGEMDIAPSRKIPLLLQNAAPRDRALAETQFAYLTRLAGLESVRCSTVARRRPSPRRAMLGELTLLVPMAGLDRPEGRNRAFEQAHREERGGHGEDQRQTRQREFRAQRAGRSGRGATARAWPT